MYERHFHLIERPFSILPDPRFIYWTRGHASAYALLEYAILHHSGITVITGEIGCGKTTLVQHLLAHLAGDVVVGLLPDTQVASGDLIRWVLLAFDRDCEQATEASAFRDFRNFVNDQHGQGRRVVLIVDEAQNLSMTALEKLRMLSNINIGSDNCLQLILAGQPGLGNLLQRPELQQFMQRVTAEFHIAPMSPLEVKNYIIHRVRLAGSTETLFSERAIRLIAEESRGIPRLVNVLCDTALVYAYARGSCAVDMRTVEHVIDDRRLNGIIRRPMAAPELKAEDAGVDLIGTEEQALPREPAEMGERT